MSGLESLDEFSRTDALTFSSNHAQLNRGNCTENRNTEHAHVVQHRHGGSANVRARRHVFDTINGIVNNGGVCPDTVEQVSQQLHVLLSGTPLQRLHSWLLLQRRVHVVSKNEVLQQHAPEPLPHKSLLPSHLPPYPYAHVGESHTSDLSIARRAAWNLVEWLYTIYSYYETGCPKSKSQYGSRFGPYFVSEPQKAAALQLCDSITSMLLVPASADWTRGRKTLLEAIDGLKDSARRPQESVSRSLSQARAVDPSRVSVPVRAATLSPLKYICPERGNILQDLSCLVIEEDLWPAIPKPCLMLSKEHEQSMRKLLLSTGMCQLIREADVPRSRSGRKLLSGLFSVPHKPHSDRLIFDRRPQNATEHRLNW